MRELSPSFLDQRTSRTNGPRILLVPPPGESHTFGLSMVYEFFRRAGWEVWADPAPGLAALSQAIATGWYDMVGLSVGSECHVETVASAILALRKASLNPAVVVMVGGPVVNLIDGFAAQVGADAMAGDARAAVAEAERLVSARAAATP